MTLPWSGVPEPRFAPLTLRETLRAGRRLMLLTLIVAATAPVFLPVRAAERILGRGRRWTTRIASIAFAAIVRALGLRRVVEGRPEGQMLVANHSSWLDIAVLFAGEPLVFVSKAEVAHWPVIGPLTRACGTIYIERRRSGAAGHAALLADALARGERVAFFPEGTSSDGQRVLPFKSALFAAVTGPVGGAAAIQPAGLRYDPPAGRAPEFHAWWGATSFGPHAMQVLGAPRGGRVTVRYGRAIAAGGDRKALARRLEAEVRALAGGAVSPPSPREGA